MRAAAWRSIYHARMMRVMLRVRHNGRAWTKSRSWPTLAIYTAVGALCGACAGAPALPVVDPIPDYSPSKGLDAAARVRVVWVSDDSGAAVTKPLPQRLLMVVDQSLDPLSVRPESFVVVTAAGARVMPTEARFVESTRFGMQRSVLLSGSFGEGLPQALLVVRPIHTTAGAALHRISAPVERRGSRPYMLFWESRAPDDGDACGDESSVVELWWSRSVQPTVAPVATESKPKTATQRVVKAPFHARSNHTMHCHAAGGGPGAPPWILPSGIVESADATPSKQAFLDEQHRVVRGAPWGEAQGED